MGYGPELSIMDAIPEIDFDLVAPQVLVAPDPRNHRLYPLLLHFNAYNARRGLPLVDRGHGRLILPHVGQPQMGLDRRLSLFPVGRSRALEPRDVIPRGRSASILALDRHERAQARVQAGPPQGQVSSSSDSE